MCWALVFAPFTLPSAKAITLPSGPRVVGTWRFEVPAVSEYVTRWQRKVSRCLRSPGGWTFLTAQCTDSHAYLRPPGGEILACGLRLEIIAFAALRKSPWFTTGENKAHDPDLPLRKLF